MNSILMLGNLINKSTNQRRHTVPDAVGADPTENNLMLSAPMTTLVSFTYVMGQWFEWTNNV